MRALKAAMLGWSDFQLMGSLKLEIRQNGSHTEATRRAFGQPVQRQRSGAAGKKSSTTAEKGVDSQEGRKAPSSIGIAGGTLNPPSHGRRGSQ